MDVHTIPTHLPHNNKQINNLSQKKSIKWTRIIWKMTTNTSDLYFNWCNSYSSTDTHNTPRFFLKKNKGKRHTWRPSFFHWRNKPKERERERGRERKKGWAGERNEPQPHQGQLRTILTEQKREKGVHQNPSSGERKKNPTRTSQTFE